VTSALELTGPATALLDDPLGLHVRGGGPDATVTWRARVRDDDGRVWRAQASDAGGLDAAWQPAKTPAAAHAALASLRPVRLEVRAELPDGRAAARTVTRVLLGDRVRVRRWRGDVAASLILPAADPVATVLLDATAGPDAAGSALLAGALLASRGALVLVVPGHPRRPAADLLAAAEARFAAVPTAAVPRVLDAAEVPLPPGVPGEGHAAARAAAWDRLLGELGVTPRQVPAAGTSRP
jgi:hypothetical protein